MFSFEDEVWIYPPPDLPGFGLQLSFHLAKRKRI